MPYNRRRVIIVGSLFALVLAGGFLWARFAPAIRPVLFPAPSDITQQIPPASNEPLPPGENQTNFPLKLPDGFSISILAKDLAGARVMRLDDFDNLWLSRTTAGAVTLLEIDRDTGLVRNQGDVFRNLNKPHGLAFAPDNQNLLYIAEEHRIWRVTTYSEDVGQEIARLPTGGGHYTRTIGFAPNGELFASVGSSCNVCREEDERRATILAVDDRPSGSTRVWAEGLRNTVFFTWDDAGRMWGTDMGRDWLGDDLPPDEINIIREGGDYGWPICYGKNVHDTEFDKNTYIRNPCEEPSTIPSHVNLPAHSAPLGLAFIPADAGWPADYVGDLLVALHGSWNRSEPDGYKIVRMKLNGAGEPEGIENFITGWLTTDGAALGRPVDLVFRPNGDLLISDDKAGVIYRVQPPRQ
ncbi:hypothetical protein C4552_04485 [Candidatus Parcubacteria bacterium]|nr:MAG: hypothetical protein C4552_04485 [Candidatus Parcubacteria bacterium]